MPVGTVTGLSSGVDWAETVDLIMQLERRPVDMLRAEKSKYNSQLSVWKSIESKLNSLDSVAEDLDSVSEFLKKSSSSSDGDIVTISAGATATEATHDIIVNQLATNAIHAHQTGWADDKSTPVNDSGSDQSFSYDYAGTSVSITVPDGTTLQKLVVLINQDEDNPGVVASILNDGTGGGADYHLLLAGEDTGEGNDITILNAGSFITDLGTGTEFDEAEWDTTKTAQNSEIRVDGFPDPAWGWSWIESATNEVEDVISDVTINLHDDSAGDTITFTISLDTATIKSGVQTLIEEYNDLIGEINSSTRYNAETEVAGALNGDSFVRNIRATLLNMIASEIPGTDSSDDYRSLGQIGLSMVAGGKLKLDSDEFLDALNADSVAVARLFAFDAETGDSFTSVVNHSEETIGGSYSYTVTYDANGEIDTSGTVTIDGIAAGIHGTQLFMGAEDSDTEGLQMVLTDPGDGPSSISSTVQVYTGLSVLLHNEIDAWTDTYDGTLKINEDQIKDSIDNLDDRIENWNSRLAKVRENYEREFLHMEILVGRLQTQGNYLSQL